jgi:hypothetical protein
MANVVQNVLIDFQVSSDPIATATDRLEEMGKVEKANTEEFKKANTEINKQTKSLDAVAAVSKKIEQSGKITRSTLQDVAAAVKGMSGTFQKEFQRGVTDELKRAGVTAEQFEAALKNGLDSAQAPVKSLRQQLKDMTLQLAEMKLRGDDNSATYRQLAADAGRLKDTIGDAAQEINNFASDTSTFDGLIQTVQGLAGGFAVVQGAVGLFGDESEELQKTLLKVNSAMAILSGLQQLQNVLQKESAASRLADVIATKAQSAAQAVFAVVVGTSTGALKAFRIALAATGVGLLVLGLVELISALKDTDEAVDDVNASLESQKRLIEALTLSVDRSAEEETARANAAGAAESELIAIRGRALLKQREYLVEVQKEQIAQRDSLDSTTQAWVELNKAIQENTDKIAGVDQQLLVASINFQGQVAKEAKEAREKAADEAKKAADEAKRLREKQLQEEKEARQAGFADYVAREKLRLLEVEKGGREELAIKQDILKAELQQELDNEKLTANQRKLAVQTYFKERLELEREYNKKVTEQNFKDALDSTNASLAQLEMTNERRLELTIDALEIQSALEIAAAEGNAAKIGLIEAQRDKAIRDARIASIQETVEYELALQAAAGGSNRRRLDQVVADAEEEFDIRSAAIDELAALDIAAIAQRIAALNEERQQGLISQRDYNLQYAQLLDQQTNIFETAEQAKTRIAEEESEKRRQKTISDIQEAVNVAAMGVSLLSSIYESQNEKENNLLKERQKRLDDLVEAGAITEKEAIARQKRLEADERQLRNRQAQREKQIALFNAGLAIPRAVLQGLVQGGPILAAVYGAIAAAEFAILAARPIPKFAKGKKDRYEGPGIVGEAGTELVESKGRMYVASKATKVWLHADDKVYNPRETAEMMSGSRMNTSIPQPMTAKKEKGVDWNKAGKEIAKHLNQNIYVDGVQVAQRQAQAFTNYLNDRRGLS